MKDDYDDDHTVIEDGFISSSPPESASGEERGDIEHLARAVHEAYLETCRRLGWPVKPENRVTYIELSEDSKELDRASVRAVLRAVREPNTAPTRDEIAGLLYTLSQFGVTLPSELNARLKQYVESPDV